jgi:ankyrin repeat protein
LTFAAQKGHLDIVEAVIENVPKINLNKGDKFNKTPISIAARNGHPDVVACLLKHNADGELADTSGNSPLHYAAAYGWLGCLKVLLKLGKV